VLKLIILLNIECDASVLGLVISLPVARQSGRINITGGIVSVNSLAPESMATLNCNTGFHPGSTASRTCQFNGQWSEGTLNCVPDFEGTCI